MSIKDRILKAADRREETMTIPEWDNVELLIRGMSGATRARFVEMSVENTGGNDEEAAKRANIKAMVPLLPDFVVDGVYDPGSKERVFSKEDVDALLEKNGEVLQRIALKVISLSGLGQKALEEAQGNSSAPPSAAST